MPPKSKKEQEEQARRLEEEQRRREEEEARLAIERKKYGAETLSTGLALPASGQLLLDLPNQTTEFITHKLKDAALSLTPNLSNDPALLTLILKELLHYTIDAASLFNLTSIKKVEGNEEQLLKGRILVGIAYSLIINQHQSLGGSGKSKQGDQRLLKQLLAMHVGKGEGRMKVLGLKQVEGVLTCLRRAYFSHFLLLFHFSSFPKREDTQQTQIYLNSATTFRNRKETPFTDLSHKLEAKQEHH